MESPITTSIVVELADPTEAGGGHLSAEIDDRPTGFNAGVTEFYAGDSPAFLVYVSSDVTITDIISTEGVVNSLGKVSITEETDFLYMTADLEVSLPVPVDSAAVTYSSGLNASPLVGESGISFATEQTAVLKVSYTCSPLAFRLVGASGLNPVQICIKAEVAP